MCNKKRPEAHQKLLDTAEEVSMKFPDEKEAKLAALILGIYTGILVSKYHIVLVDKT